MWLQLLGYMRRSLTSSLQSAQGVVSSLQSEVAELKRRVWESESEAQAQCVPWVLARALALVLAGMADLQTCAQPR